MAKKMIKYQELVNVVRGVKSNDAMFEFFLSACKNANLQICQICLDAGADINIRESFHKESLLDNLISSGKFTTEVGDWLIEKGVDVNVMSYYSDMSSLSMACLSGNIEIVKYFIDKGLKIRQPKDDNVKHSDLDYAVWGGNDEVVKMLFELGADLDEYAYIRALEGKKCKIVELFLQNGASANINCGGYRPLHIATKNHDIQTANILLEYNAKVNAKIKWLGCSFSYGDHDFVLTPMDIAVSTKDIDMQKLLESFGGSVSSKEEKIQVLVNAENFKDECCSALKKIMKS